MKLRSLCNYFFTVFKSCKVSLLCWWLLRVRPIWLATSIHSRYSSCCFFRVSSPMSTSPLHSGLVESREYIRPIRLNPPKDIREYFYSFIQYLSLHTYVQYSTMQYLVSHTIVPMCKYSMDEHTWMLAPVVNRLAAISRSRVRAESPGTFTWAYRVI